MTVWFPCCHSNAVRLRGQLFYPNNMMAQVCLHSVPLLIWFYLSTLHIFRPRFSRQWPQHQIHLHFWGRVLEKGTVKGGSWRAELFDQHQNLLYSMKNIGFKCTQAREFSPGTSLIFIQIASVLLSSTLLAFGFNNVPLKCLCMWRISYDYTIVKHVFLNLPFQPCSCTVEGI